jgi:hypothetical protein
MHKRQIAFLSILSLFLSLHLIPANAAAKAGGTCSKAGITSVAASKTYTCIKSGKKLVWNKGAAVAKPTTAANYATLWEKYGLTKPTNSNSISTSATEAFNTFTDVQRSPNQVVIVKTQEGVDPLWNNLITSGMSLIAKSFTYPSFNAPIYALAGLDAGWMVNTFVSLGFTKAFGEQRIGNDFDNVVANAGGNTAIWNIANINKLNLLKNDKVGMYQTAGHEFFHPIQQQLYKGGNKFPPDGSGGPQWFLEGSAKFIGVQTNNKLGQLSYEEEGRPNLVRNVLSGDATSSGKLEDAKYNLNRSSDVFPYDIGALGVEFLVANVGIQKMVDVFSQMGTGKSFSVAFKNATRIELTDFYSMFEEARPVLGIPRS